MRLEAVLDQNLEGFGGTRGVKKVVFVLAGLGFLQLRLFYDKLPLGCASRPILAPLWGPSWAPKTDKLAPRGFLDRGEDSF